MKEKKEPKYIDMSAHLEVDVSGLFGKKTEKQKTDEASAVDVSFHEGSEKK